MAYSGSIAGVSFTTMKLIEHAFRRCKVKTEAVTAEMLETAKDCLQLMLQSATNESWPLWTQERNLLGITVGQSYVETLPGTIEMIDISLRNPSRSSGTATSSAGGTVANAFDDDFETECVQAAPNGNIQVEFDSQITLVTVGVLPGATATWSWVFERSQDGVTWESVLVIEDQAVVDRQWLWYDLQGYLASYYFRMRATDGTTLELRELYPAHQCTSIPITRLNIDQYANMPDQQRRGAPYNYFYDRQVDTPLLRLWMVPNEQYKNYHLAAWRKRAIMDVGTFTQEIEVPKAMYEAFVWNLAWRLCCEIPEVDASKLQYLKPTADEAWKMARTEGRDRSQLLFQPNIRGYTR